MKPFALMSSLMVFVTLTSGAPAEKKAEVESAESTDLEGSESQSFGYGYGTKVADKYSVATGETITKCLRL